MYGAVNASKTKKDQNIMKILNPYLLCLALLGCASASRPAAPAGPSAAEEEGALLEAVERLDKAKSDAVVPRARNDCQTVCMLAVDVQKAADAICNIARRHKGEASFVKRCNDADRDDKEAQINCESCSGLNTP